MGAVHMLKIFYFVYKPTGKLLPVMPHCDNDFETMALKHSIAFDKMAEKSQAAGRRLADFDHKCGCPYLPGYVDVADASWMYTRKNSGSFLRTLYRFSEVLSGGYFDTGKKVDGAGYGCCEVELWIGVFWFWLTEKRVRVKQLKK